MATCARSPSPIRVVHGWCSSRSKTTTRTARSASSARSVRPARFPPRPHRPPPPPPPPHPRSRSAAAPATATPGPTPTPTVVATAQPAPAVVHDAQYYAQTGFRVDDQAVSFFQSRGAVDTFGYPISRLYTFLGCPVQMYQRLIIQLCPGAGPQLINLLDPDIFPYTRVNATVFPQ